MKPALKLCSKGINYNCACILVPMPQVVLLQELDRWNKLIISMEYSLQQVRKALAGEIGMSKELDDLGTALFNGQLPAFWRKMSPQVIKTSFKVLKTIMILHLKNVQKLSCAWKLEKNHNYERATF